MISRETVRVMRKMDAEGVQRKDIMKATGCSIHTIIYYCGMSRLRNKVEDEKKSAIAADIAAGKPIKVVAFDHNVTYIVAWRIASNLKKYIEVPAVSRVYRKAQEGHT